MFCRFILCFKYLFLHTYQFRYNLHFTIALQFSRQLDNADINMPSKSKIICTTSKYMRHLLLYNHKTQHECHIFALR